MSMTIELLRVGSGGCRPSRPGMLTPSGLVLEKRCDPRRVDRCEQRLADPLLEIWEAAGTELAHSCGKVVLGLAQLRASVRHDHPERARASLIRQADAAGIRHDTAVREAKEELLVGMTADNQTGPGVSDRFGERARRRRAGEVLGSARGLP